LKREASRPTPDHEPADCESRHKQHGDEGKLACVDAQVEEQKCDRDVGVGKTDVLQGWPAAGSSDTELS